MKPLIQKIKTTAQKEKQLLKLGYKKIIGIDEVGRGSWAGPVIVAGFVFTNKTKVMQGVTDSKLLTPKKRNYLVPYLQTSDSYTIKVGSVSLINKLGVGKTINQLILSIIKENKSPYTYFLIDGNLKINFDHNIEFIIKGDQKHYAISASSIIAKEYRDNIMKKYSLKYQKYGFETNVGYPSQKHINALNCFGPISLHRKSFKPIQALLNNA